MIENLKCDSFHWSACRFNNMQIALWSLFIPICPLFDQQCFIQRNLWECITKGHIRAYWHTRIRVWTYAYTRIYIRVYAKYERIIRVCVVRIYLSCTVHTFLNYANEKGDDIIGSSTKTVQHSIKNISRNIGAMFFKLGTRNVHHKRNRMTPTTLLPWQHSLLQSLSLKNIYPSLQSF